MSRRLQPLGILIVVASVAGMASVTWVDADAAGRGGGRGGGMSRSSPARSGGMSSRPAPARTPQTANRQAAPAPRPAAQPSRTPGTTQGTARPQDSTAARQGNLQENQGQRQGQLEEGREDRQDYRDEAREDRQDYYEDWDDHGYYYGYDDDFAEAMVVGVTVGAVFAAADYEDDVATTTTTITNVTNVTALASLPCEARITVANGISYYQCDTTWYTRAYEGDNVVYVPSGPPPSR